MRVTSEFRVLNAVTENLAYPTEDVKNIVQWIAAKKVYSVPDRTDECYNAKLRTKDRHLTAVRTVLGLFEYAVMAQGLKGACVFFQKMVNEMYVGLRLTVENELGVSHGLVRPSDDHTAVFATFREPRNASELLRFIRLVLFFSEHVGSAADRPAPFYEVPVGTG
jgi:hypothetical protein